MSVRDLGSRKGKLEREADASAVRCSVTTMTTAAATGTGITSTTDVAFAADTDNNTTGIITFATATVERMRIQNDGKIVIGATSTTKTFEVVGSVQATSFDTTATNTWGKVQVGGLTALTSTAASIAINLGTTNNFTHTMTENTTLAAPSNPTAGQTGTIVFTQHASAAKTLAFNSVWKSSTGSAIAISTTVGSINIFTYFVVDSTHIVYAFLTTVQA